jgi:hypothetical protein
MSLSVLPAIGSWVVALTLPLQAVEENKTADVFRDHSPDKKFAMRIVCDAEFAEEKEIPNHAFHSASIVRLPGKEEAASLLSTDSLAGFSDLVLVWSADSQWCAFYSCTNRVGFTTVFQRSGERFVEVPGKHDLSAPNDVDKRNEHISPVRWLKPGVLLLEHRIVPRGEGRGFHAHFTATYDAKAKKFRIGGVKKIGK